jgi:hypothetical protein
LSPDVVPEPPFHEDDQVQGIECALVEVAHRVLLLDLDATMGPLMAGEIRIVELAVFFWVAPSHSGLTKWFSRTIFKGRK